MSNSNWNEIENKIYAILLNVIKDYRKLPKEKLGSNKWLTNQVKENIGELGESMGFKICSTIHGGEWLYDLVWYKEDHDKSLIRVPLILESELSDRGSKKLKYDFEKLLLANSEMRIFFCFTDGNYRYPTNTENLIKFFEKSVNSYEGLIKGARIAVFIWDDYTTDNLDRHLITKK